MIKTSHPKKVIQAQLEICLKQLFGIDHKPRVVRQERGTSTTGALTYIDYSVPCFELARYLDRKPRDVTKELQTVLSSVFTEGAVDISVDAIEGYLNFQLGDSYIKRIFDAQYNTTLGDTPEDEKLSYRILSFQSLNDREDKDFYYSAEKQLVEAMKLIPGRRNIQIFHYYEASNNSIGIKRRLDRSKYSYSYINVVKVHEYLDKQMVHIPGVVSDVRTGAIYFIDPGADIALPLRSAKGRVYGYAYMAYLVDQRVERQDGEKVNTIALLPQRVHAFIQQVAGAGENICLFDPNVSKADIRETKSRRQHDKALDDIEKVLKSVPSQYIYEPDIRKMLLALHDFRYDLHVYSDQLMLPAIYSAINDTYLVLELLSRKNIVQIPTD